MAIVQIANVLIVQRTGSSGGKVMFDSFGLYIYRSLSVEKIFWDTYISNIQCSCHSASAPCRVHISKWVGIRLGYSEHRVSARRARRTAVINSI